MKVLLSLLLSINLYASSFKIDSSIPVYLRSLLKQASYENKEFTTKKINEFLNSFNTHLDFLESKILILVLNESLNLDRDSFELNQESYNMAKNSLSKINEDSAFSKVLFESFVHDLGEMITDRKYQSYLTQEKSTSRRTDPNLKDYTRQMRLIKPWIKMLVVSSGDQIALFMREFNTKTLNDIIKNAMFLNKMNKSNKPKEAKNYITLIDDGLEKARKEVDALDFKLFPNKKENYNSPEKLPTPINDWTPNP